MCGIFGYIGSKNVKEVIIEGLYRLEYRGYDAAGIGVVLNNTSVEHKLISRVVVGFVSDLENTILQEPWNDLSIAIGHVRWPTHGHNTIPNAHPHFDCKHQVMLVHNGEIKNFTDLKQQLASHEISSETDTELIAHVIEEELAKNHIIGVALTKAIQRLDGNYAIAICIASEPNAIYVVRMGNPLVIGVGNNEMFIASEPYAFSNHTNRVIVVDDGMIIRVTQSDVELIRNENDGFSDLKIQVMDIPEQYIDHTKHAHHMRREIDQQPEVIRQIVSGRFTPDRCSLNLLTSNTVVLEQSRNILIGCGTAYHAALLGKVYLEAFTSMPTSVFQASEFEVSPSCQPQGANIIAISQSGETWDTREAIKIAKSEGAISTMAIINAVCSSLERDVVQTIHMRAGIEIGVAATKTFTAQCITLLLLALDIRQRQGKVTGIDSWFKKIEAMPDLIRHCIDSTEPRIRDIASECAARFSNTMFIGKKQQLPVAREGALKLKEIAYVPSDAQPSGELKHGPLALIDQRCLSVILLPYDHQESKAKQTFWRNIISLKEIKARRGPSLAVTTDDAPDIESDWVVRVPQCDSSLLPLLTIIPLQLLAYHWAIALGLDPDKPRNLAKSVTVG